MRAIKPFNISNFNVPKSNPMTAVSPQGRGMLLDDITRDILKRIEQHERMIFAHICRHDCACHDHQEKMTYHHPHHSHRSHPLHRRF